MSDLTMEWDIIPSFDTDGNNSSPSDRPDSDTKTGSTSLKSSNSERKKKDARSVRPFSHNRANAARRVRSQSRKTKTGSTSLKSSSSERKRKNRNDDVSELDFVHAKAFKPKLLQTRVASKLRSLIGRKQSQTYMLAPYSGEEPDLGVQTDSWGDKFEIHAPITIKHFRSYIKLPLQSLKGPLNKNKSQVAKHLQKYLWHFSKENKELLETAHVAEYMNSLGYTEDSFELHEKYGNNFNDVLYRCHIVSLELVHDIPLIHTVRPGTRNCGWFNRLAEDDKDEVNKNLHRLKPFKRPTKGTQSLLSRSAESKSDSKSQSAPKTKSPTAPASEPTKPSPIPWSELGKKTAATNSGPTPWSDGAKKPAATWSELAKKPAATTKPSSAPNPPSKKRSGTNLPIKKVNLLGHSIELQVVRPDNWNDSVQHHLQSNGIFMHGKSLPDNYRSHCYLARLSQKKLAALKKSAALLKEEKAKKVFKKNDDVYDDGWDDGPYADERFGGYVDSDGESVDSCVVSGITRTTVTEFDLCYFMENLIHTNMVWDLGCQVQAFCRDTKKSGSPVFKTCYCPLGFHNKAWRKETGLQDRLVEPNEIEKCDNHTFKNPYDFWTHCKSKSNHCILHHCMLKYLELQYSDICTKNNYNVKVSNAFLFSLKVFSVER